MFFTSWTSTARPGDEDAFDVYGYKFSWTPRHQTSEELRPLKFSYDKIGDDVLDQLRAAQAAEPVEERPVQTGRDGKPKQDLWKTLKAEAEKGGDPLIDQFWKDVHTVPDWVDWDQIERGQRVSS